MDGNEMCSLGKKVDEVLVNEVMNILCRSANANRLCLNPSRFLE